MRTGAYYLNNSGHRWVTFENGKKVKQTFYTKSGLPVIRTIIFFESFGNFATCTISYKGKKISVFADQLLND